MHALRSVLIIAGATLAGTPSLMAQAPPAPAPTPATSPQVRTAPAGRRSPHETTSTVIGDRRTGNRVVIVYGRPYIKDPRTGEPRKIWGGLVPFGKVWRTGADEATLLVTQQPLLFGTAKIPAGACTLFMLPAEDGSAKLIFNRQIGQWGLQYDDKQDIARVDLKRESLEKPADQLTITVENNPAGGGVIKLAWESVQYSAAFSVSQ